MDVLGRTLVSLDAGKDQSITGGYFPGDSDYRIAPLDAAAASTTVYFDQTFDGDLMFACCGRQIVDIADVIDAH